MHGIIFSELKKFADTRFGARGWDRILQRAGLERRIYVPTQEYPDEEATRIVTAAAAAARLSVPEVMEDFGAFIVPDLLRLYGELVDPSWQTLDVIEHTEAVIHRVVRLRDAGARPPALVVQRAASDHLIITYGSARRMCGIARGIVRGVAAHYGEVVDIVEPMCMLDGAPRCSIEVRARASDAGA
jgi:hypothetical protein